MTPTELAVELRRVACALFKTVDAPTPAKVCAAYGMVRRVLAQVIADEWNAAHPVGTVVEIDWGDWPTPTRSATDSAAWAEGGKALVYIERFGDAVPVEELRVVTP